MKCPACQHENPAPAELCGRCGVRLKGERKQVTVLFADVTGSVALVSQLGHEVAQPLIDAAVERMIEAVRRYDGTVTQVSGDGIMALFGAPHAQEDHAVRACYAALGMQATIREYGKEVQLTQGVPIQIHAGLNSGEAEVGTVGMGGRSSYTAVGQIPNLAARTAGIAGAGEILITADTWRLAKGYVEARELGPAAVKGLAAPIEVFVLTGTGLARTRFQARALQSSLSRFVGRREEMDELLQAAEVAASGRGQVVGVFGEPGVGKSRLFHELTRLPDMNDWAVLEAQAGAYGTAMSLDPVGDLMRAYFKVGTQDEHRSIREKVRGELLVLDESFRRFETPLPSVLGMPVDDARWRGLEPAERWAETADAVKTVLVRESAAQKLALVLEDLHTIAPETEALLESLVEDATSARLLVLFNYRREYRPRLAERAAVTLIPLGALAPEHAESLVASLLGAAPGVEPLRRLLIARARGNPFFIEETVRDLVEKGVLIGRAGAYEARGLVADIGVPETVHAVVAARVDRLSQAQPYAKQVLQTAAVIGPEVPLPLLRSVCGLPDADLRRALVTLGEAEFLDEIPVGLEVEYSFRHVITREVVYESFLREERRALHGRVVDAMQALHADRLEEQAERLGHHAFQAGRWEAAASYLRVAGLRAATQGAHGDAVNLLRRAAEALTHLPAEGATRELAIDLRFDRRDLLHSLGRSDEVADCLAEAEELARGGNDQRRVARAVALRAQHLRMTGEAVRAVGAADEALAMGHELGDAGLRRLANLILGEAHHALGEFERAKGFLIEVLREEAGGAWSDVLPGTSVRARSLLAWCCCEQGELDPARVWSDDALTLAERAGQPTGILVACLGEGYCHLVRGEPSEAARVLDRGLELCVRNRLAVWFPVIGSLSGYACVRVGRLDEGIKRMEHAVEQAIAMHQTEWHARRLVLLAEGYFAAGDRERATQLCEAGLALARRHGERGSEAYGLWLRAAMGGAAERGATETPEGAYSEALTAASGLGMRPLVAHCHLGLCGLHRRGGRSGEAKAHVEEAVALYSAMGMQRWLEKAETEAGT